MDTSTLPKPRFKFFERGECVFDDGSKVPQLVLSVHTPDHADLRKQFYVNKQIWDSGAPLLEYLRPYMIEQCRRDLANGGIGWDQAAIDKLFDLVPPDWHTHPLGTRWERS